MRQRPNPVGQGTQSRFAREGSLRLLLLFVGAVDLFDLIEVPRLGERLLQLGGQVALLLDFLGDVLAPLQDRVVLFVALEDAANLDLVQVVRTLFSVARHERDRSPLGVQRQNGFD